MNIRFIAASAGSGKTWRLTQELESAIASGRARASGILAVTFTKQAASELVERARARLLRSGLSSAAHELLAARVGTVNAVCGSLVNEHAFELGLSPGVRIIDDASAELELRRALQRVVSTERAAELDSFSSCFGRELDWRDEVQELVEAARANNIDAECLARYALRSSSELDSCLGPTTTDHLDDALVTAVSAARDAIVATDDETKKSADYVALLRRCLADLDKPSGLSWGDWARLAKDEPAKRSRVHAETTQQSARRHIEHPRLRAGLHRYIHLVYEVAGQVLAEYSEHKRRTGVLDLLDQEALALELLQRHEIRDALTGQIDLFLVDEFQDTSPIQLALFLALARLAKESIWVGDPKQAIYGFRGTDPALMDAAVEALTSVATDPDLVAKAVEAVNQGRLETLARSYRSRPGLVELTSAMFVRAFADQGMPEERTRLYPADADEPPGLGELVEHWPLDLDRGAGNDNERGRAAALAAGVQDLLARAPRARDANATRKASPRDVAILCRTNAQCQAVADELGALGIPAIVPRTHLLNTPEVRVARAGLALWADPFDTLAMAELARIISHPTDLDGFAARVFSAPGRDAFANEPAVQALQRARELEPDLGAVAAVDAVLRATDLRALCASWGSTDQRIANLDALRAHASLYARRAAVSSRISTIAGLLHYLDALAPAFLPHGERRADHQALLTGADAITISTWHGAKGLEWPITVLFGLETMRQPDPYGVHVLSDRDTLDIDDPLGGRWVRFWPNPYSTRNQLGAVRIAYESTPIYASIVAKARREALRVLYVGWTRARDRLVLAAKRGSMFGGIAGILPAIDPTLLTEPSSVGPGVERVTWAGVSVDVRVAPSSPASPVVQPPQPGAINQGGTAAARYPARATASTCAAVPAVLGETVTLGPRLSMQGAPDMHAVGDAMHAVLAADRRDRPDSERIQLARDILTSYKVDAQITAADVIIAANRLWQWIDVRFAPAVLHREWPLALREPVGTVITGTADVVVASAGGLIVIDHKTFPGTTQAAAQRALGYSGQLAAYGRALREATGRPVLSTWIHYPVRGRLLEVRVEGSTTSAGENDP